MVGKGCSRRASALCQLGGLPASNVLDELVDDRAPALVEAHLGVLLGAVGVLVDGDRPVGAATAAVVGELEDGREGHVTGLGPVVGGERGGPHEAFVRGDLQVAAGAVHHLLAVGVVHDGAEASSGSQVDLAERDRVRPGREPLLERLRVGPRLEHGLRRDGNVGTSSRSRSALTGCGVKVTVTPSGR